MGHTLRVFQAAVVLVVAVVLIVVVLQPARLMPARAWQSIRAKTMTLWARTMLAALGISRRVSGHRPQQNVLFVANHISWLDILVLMATWRGVFLAKAELASWPLIGWMCRHTDTLFLQRGSARALAEKMSSITQVLNERENVYLFPEGTTTGGREVRSFYPGLFQAAIDAGVAVQPVALGYREAGQVSDCAPFINDDDFVKHLVRVLKAKSLVVQVTFLSKLNSVNQDRRQLACLAHGLISREVGHEVAVSLESMV